MGACAYIAAMTSATPLSPAQVDALERQVDAAFGTALLPTENRYSSRWAVLRTCEDQLRFALLRTAAMAAIRDTLGDYLKAAYDRTAADLRQQVW